jgi:SAM-dependent methyltransferase
MTRSESEAIHHAAAQGFEAGADTYAKGRPDYPPALTDWLRRELRLDASSTALDLGAGTGKFLPRLLETRARVIAIEPVDAMRARLAAAFPDVEIKAGRAEQIPLAAEAVDAVTCAQAFHWFANPRAMQEIRRVLKPGGALGLIWNIRDESVAWVRELTRIIEPFEADTPRYHSEQWREAFPAEGFSSVAEASFTNAHEGAAEQVIVDRTLSISFIAALAPEQRNQVADRIRDLIANTPELAGKAAVRFPYRTVAFSCHKQS